MSGNYPVQSSRKGGQTVPWTSASLSGRQTKTAWKTLASKQKDTEIKIMLEDVLKQGDLILFTDGSVR